MTDLSSRVALTPQEAAEAIGISKRAIQMAYLGGDLPVHYRSPRRPLILVDDLKAWVAAAPTERAAS